MVYQEPKSKRLLDICLSTLMLGMALPVIAPISALIKIEDGGPVLYRQTRWGRNGTHFGVFKFRTMVPDAEKKFGITQARENDDRITRIGRLLRAMGLDELPQIFNILVGDMSFVGPRSLAVNEVLADTNNSRVTYEQIRGFQDRLAARPGLTGLATVYIPKDSSPRRKFRYDLLYLRKHSLCLDVHLIALSFWISFRGRWETRRKKF
jgi:lipopolysaccharide/colanic/teichoic acid biosynthesis glycosyltransferase